MMKRDMKRDMKRGMKCDMKRDTLHPIVLDTRTASLPCTDISKTDACGMV